MQRTVSLLVAVVLVAAGFAWYLNRPDRGVATALEAEATAPAVLAPDAGELRAAGDRESERGAELAAGDAGSQRTDAAREVAGAGEWVEGTIALPLGAPAEDLGVYVLARRSSPDREEWSELLLDPPADLVRVPVDDGRFRFRQGADGASRLWLDSDWLYLEQSALAEGTDAVRLEALLGGALEVHGQRPAGAAPDEVLEGIEVVLIGMSGEGAGMWGGLMTQEKARLDADGKVLFGGLPSDMNWMLRSTPERWASHSELGIEIVSGQTATTVIAYRLGARIAGVVTNSSGRPVEGANVSFEPTNRFARMGGERDPAVTDASGAYRLFGVRPGKGALSVDADDYLHHASDELELRDAEVREGVDVVLSDGLAIAGLVRQADGAPAAGALVVAERAVEDGDMRRWEPGRDDSRHAVTADGDGRFRISGLTEGEYRVVADFDGPDGVSWRDVLPEVAAGGPDVTLTVVPPPGVWVRVTDSTGAPVTQATISVTEPSDDLNAWFMPRSRTARFVAVAQAATERRDAEDGRFFVEDVWRGPWNVRVEADGMVQETVPFEVFVDGESEVLVRMLPACSISGTIVDPSGNQVRGARASLRDPKQASSTPWGMSFGGDIDSDRTDKAGAFRITDIAPGSYELVGSDDDWSSSPSRGIDLQPGDRLDGVVLTLREGGTIHGVVYDQDGQPEAGRSIMAFTQSNSGGTPENVTSDERGEFTLAKLEPGTYQVMAQPDMRKVQQEMEGQDNPSPATFMRMMEMTTATVVDGEVTEITLGAPPEAPVRVHGRVTKSGVAVDGGMVSVLREGGSILDNFEPADVQMDGSYELTVDGAGRATLIYSREGFGRAGTEFAVEIPERAEYRLDLELPGGSISGRLLGPDAGPLTGQIVSLDKRSGMPAVTGMGMGSMARTDEDGRFRFEDLEAGTYDLRAGGASFFDGSGDLAATVVPGVEVRDGKPTPELTIELGGSGEVAGRVLGPDGQPAQGVALYVRNADGSLIARVSSVSTDANGRFVYKGLPSGDVLVEARGNAGAADPVPVRVREGERTDVEVRLTDATMLRVRAEDQDGNPTRMRLSVTDEAGREMAGLRSMSNFQERMARGLNTSEREVGPLPPGKYVVLGTDDAGHEEKRTVTLKGQKERLMRLRFSGD